MRAPLRASRLAAALAGAAALFLAGCASAGTLDADGHVLGTPRRGSVSDVSSRLIQGQALTADPARSMLDVLAAYWPITMRGDPRAAQLGGDRGLGVYVNGSYMGGWDVLRTVRAGEVVRVQRLTTSEEYMRFGRSSANGGVILTMRGASGR